MSQYRKKPVVIEAKQLTVESLKEIYTWVHGEEPSTKHPKWDDYVWYVQWEGMNIPTLEDGSDGRAKHVASINDWIIKGVHGEFYPCKPDIFEMTYESAETPQQEVVKPGYVQVPMLLTREMDAVLMDEDWQWADVLAAAEAVTEEQYEKILAHPSEQEVFEKWFAETNPPGDGDQVFAQWINSDAFADWTESGKNFDA